MDPDWSLLALFIAGKSPQKVFQTAIALRVVSRPFPFFDNNSCGDNCLAQVAAAAAAGELLIAAAVTAG